MKKIVLLLFACCFFTHCSNDMDNDVQNDSEYLLITPGNCFPEAKDKYVYPNIPAMASEDEKHQLRQIPDKLLKSLSTYALIQSLIDKPSLQMEYMLSSNSSPVGTSYKIYSNHNSVSELEKRDDKIEALTTYYEAICFDCLQSIEFTYFFSIQMTALEVLFTRDAILGSLNSAQKKQTVALLLDKYKQKKNVQYTRRITRSDGCDHGRRSISANIGII